MDSLFLWLGLYLYLFPFLNIMPLLDFLAMGKMIFYLHGFACTKSSTIEITILFPGIRASFWVFLSSITATWLVHVKLIWCLFLDFVLSSCLHFKDFIGISSWLLDSTHPNELWNHLVRYACLGGIIFFFLNANLRLIGCIIICFRV